MNWRAVAVSICRVLELVEVPFSFLSVSICISIYEGSIACVYRRVLSNSLFPVYFSTNVNMDYGFRFLQARGKKGPREVCVCSSCVYCYPPECAYVCFPKVGGSTHPICLMEYEISMSKYVPETSDSDRIVVETPHYR